MKLLFWTGWSGKRLTEKVTFEPKEVQKRAMHISRGGEPASIRDQQDSQYGRSRICVGGGSMEVEWQWGG